MSSLDVRFNTHHIIVDGPEKWSTDWSRFPGVPVAFYIELMGLKYGDFFHRLQQDYWWTAFGVVVVYLSFIFWLKRLMAERKPMSLRKPLAIWNTYNAFFAIVGTIRCLPEFFDVLTNKGLVASFCDNSYYEDIRLNIWYWLFIMAKVVELGDTVFIVLRKQKLTYLHLIHHSSSLIFCWYVFGDVPSTARWMVNMNFVVHSFMYSYYLLKSMRFRVPRALALSITSAQIIQMLVGVVINVKAYHYKITGRPCDLSRSVATTGATIYLTFWILFVNFFIHTYLRNYFSQRKSIKFIEDESDINHNQKNKIA